MSDPLYQLFSEGLDIEIDRLDDDTSPDNTTEWDSLASINLVALIEEQFEVELSTRDIMKMQTIGLARSVLQTKGVAGI